MLGQSSLVGRLAGLGLYGGAPAGGLAEGVRGSFAVAGGTTIHARWKMKKGSLSCNQGSKARPKFLGRKVSAGQFVKPCGSIFLQRGSKMMPGMGAARARDMRIYALHAGIVRYGKNHEAGTYRYKRVQISVEKAPEDHPEFVAWKHHQKQVADRLRANQERLANSESRRTLVPEYAKDLTLLLKRCEHFFKSRGKEGALDRKVWLT